MRKKNMTKMEKVSKEIIEIKFEQKDTLKNCLEKFFAILRKFGIKQSTPQYDENGKIIGRLTSNFDYTMYETLFLHKIEDACYWQLHFEEIPEDVK